MRYVLTVLSLVLIAALVILWGTGWLDRLAIWAAGQQKEFQTGIARALRSIRAGEAGAIAALLAACFAYGLAHAAGPGHGKVLIGGYGFARQVPMLRLSAIALLASLGQAITAVVLVYAGVLILNASRQAMVDTTEALMAPVSYGAIALIGLWLVWRGARKLMHRHHDHLHEGDAEVCASCGHAHGPSLDQVEQAGTLKEALALIFGIAVRPCTGALFVLIITWQMGIGMVGIVGAFAMALGTALVTIGVGMAAGGLRGGLLAGLAGSSQLARVVASVEVLAGGAVALIAGGLLLRML